MFVPTLLCAARETHQARRICIIYTVGHQPLGCPRDYQLVQFQASPFMSL